MIASRCRALAVFLAIILLAPWKAYSYCGGGGVTLPPPPQNPPGPATGGPGYPSPGSSVPSGGSWTPGGRSGAGPNTGTPGNPGNGPTTPGAGGAGSPVRPSPASGTRSGGGATLAPEPWLIWWQMNASDFLRPNRLGSLRTLTTGEEFAKTSPPPQIAEERKKAVAKILPFLDHPDHMVKVAAVLALGKLGDKELIAPLLRKLSDAHPEVRESAILALGATGEEEVVPTLLRIAECGALEKGEQRITPRAKQYALVALGIGRQRGLSARVDGFINAVAKSQSKGESEALGHGALLFDTIAPAEGLDPMLANYIADGEAPRSLRCRAIETLGSRKKLESLTKVINALNEEDAQIRRSAALALGSFGEPSAIPYLQKAVEKDRDEVAQGFALISLGRIGGSGARALLAKTLEEGPSRNLPWCALALGILARNGDDEGARKLLRDRFDRVKNHEIKGAFLVALGLAKDPQAVPYLENALERESDLWMRNHAALALAMSGAPTARGILLAKIEKEDSSYLRVIYCMGLGYLGDSRDVAIMVKSLRELNNPQLQGSLAMALGYHGSKESMQGLFDTIDDKKTPDSAKGAAIEAVGILLSADPTPILARVARQANFEMFPDWMTQLLQLTI